MLRGSGPVRRASSARPAAIWALACWSTTGQRRTVGHLGHFDDHSATEPPPLLRRLRKRVFTEGASTSTLRLRGTPGRMQQSAAERSRAQQWDCHGRSSGPLTPWSTGKGSQGLGKPGSESVLFGSFTLKSCGVYTIFAASSRVLALRPVDSV